MQESHGEGLASHTGPESCGGARKDADEALTGGRAGQAIELRNENLAFGRALRSADAVVAGGRPHHSHRQREVGRGSAQSKTLGMHGHTLRGSREIPSSPVGTAGRIGKSNDTRR
jgi:RNA-directed DNA polymerase